MGAAAILGRIVSGEHLPSKANFFKTSLSFKLMGDYAIGVDLGGTNLRAAAISRDGEMLKKVNNSHACFRWPRHRDRRHRALH